MNICEINNKYFAYQTPEYISIINIKTFQAHCTINYKINSIFHENGINKFNNKIIGAISENTHTIDFFNIDSGKKEYEIIDNENFVKGFIHTKREKNELIVLSEYCSDRGGGYGFDKIFLCLIINGKRFLKLILHGLILLGIYMRRMIKLF